MSRFLCVDIGAGIMDVLWFDTEAVHHYKAVVVPPVRTIAERAARLPGDLVVTGCEMGGGPVTADRPRRTAAIRRAVPRLRLFPMVTGTKERPARTASTSKRPPGAHATETSKRTAFRAPASIKTWTCPPPMNGLSSFPRRGACARSWPRCVPFQEPLVPCLESGAVHAAKHAPPFETPDFGLEKGEEDSGRTGRPVLPVEQELAAAVLEPARPRPGRGRRPAFMDDLDRRIEQEPRSGTVSRVRTFEAVQLKDYKFLLAALFLTLIFSGIIFYGIWKSKRVKEALLWLCFLIAGFFPVALMNHVNEQYTYFSMPFVAILIAIGAGCFLDKTKGKSRIIFTAVFILFLLLNSVSVLEKSRQMQETGEQADMVFEQIGHYLPQIEPNGTLVLVNPPDKQIRYSVFRLPGFETMRRRRRGARVESG